MIWQRVLTIFLIPPCLLLAQDPAEIEKLMTRRVLDCADIAYNSSLLIPRYFHDHKIDSVRMIYGWLGDSSKLRTMKSLGHS